MTKQLKSKVGEKKKKVVLKSSMKKKSPASKTNKQPQGKTKGPAKLKKTQSQSKGKAKGVLAKKANVKKVTKITKAAVSKTASKPKTPTTKIKPIAKVKAAVKNTSTKTTNTVKASGKGKAKSANIKQALKLIKEASKTASKTKSTLNSKSVTPAKSSKTAKPKAAKAVPVKNSKTPGQKLKTEIKGKSTKTPGQKGKIETKGKSPKKGVGTKTVVKPQKQIKRKPNVTNKQKGGKLSDKKKQNEIISKPEANKGKTMKKTVDLKPQKEIKTTKNSEKNQTAKKRKAESVAVQNDIPTKKKATEVKPKPKKQTTIKAALAKRKVAIETANMIQRSPRERKPKVFHDFLVFTDKGAPEKKMMDSEKKAETEQRKRKTEKSPQVPAKKVKKSDEKADKVVKTIKPNSDNKENKQVKVQPKIVQRKKVEKSAEREKLTKVKNKENKKSAIPKNKQTREKKTPTPRKNGKKVIQDEDPDDLKMKAILSCERKVQWKDDKSPCWITGIAALQTGQTIIADMSNKKLKLLDSEYNIVAVQSLPSCPQAISASPHEKNSAYFTMPFEKCGIQKITATKGDCLEITEKIPTAGTTRGITCTKEGIITSVDSPTPGDNYQEGFRIDIMNYKGKVLKSIQDTDLLKLPLYLAASNSTDIIIANCRKGSPSIVKIDKKGTVDYKYEGESSSKLSIEPRGITTDEDHNVYVSEWRSNFVYILSPTGKRSKILLRGEDIMTVGSFFSRPYQLCYTKSEGKPRKLIVSFESWDRIKIFNIVKFQQQS